MSLRALGVNNKAAKWWSGALQNKVEKNFEHTDGKSSNSRPSENDYNLGVLNCLPWKPDSLMSDKLVHQGYFTDWVLVFG